jgi:hypothetical protein
VGEKLDGKSEGRYMNPATAAKRMKEDEDAVDARAEKRSRHT